MQVSSVRINNMTRNTEHICPNCKDGYILDQRAVAKTKDSPFWICSNSSKNCSYREKFNKTWQWASWEWNVPYFIEIEENEIEKKARIDYENLIMKQQDDKKKLDIAETKIQESIKICRDCGKRDCNKINRCLS